MVDYKKGIPRTQLVLFQQRIDELVEDENIVRIIDAYVDSLDMRALGFQINENDTGAPAYRPQVKLKIYVYGYMNRMRSSRRLERECKRNVEMMWLTEGLAPDFKTIADFRKDNREALKEVFKAFLKMCHRLQLLSFATVAVDGTKMRAQNSLNEIYRREQIEKVEQDIQTRIDGYLRELDEVDERESADGVSENRERVEEITKRLKKQQRRKDKVEAIRRLFDEDEELQSHFATDEESRLQSDKGKVRAGYNVQTAVGGQHKLIVAAEVTNEQNDKKQLRPMIEEIRREKQELGIEEETDVIADCGYYTEKAIMDTKDAPDCRPVVPPTAEGTPPGPSRLGKGKNVPTVAYENDKFVYDEERDVYICPENEELNRITKRPATGTAGERETHKYRCDAEICLRCSARTACTTSRNGRMLRVSANRREMEAYQASLESDEHKRLISKRKEIVEHPYGTLKRSLGYSYFLVKGIEKVTGEFSLMCFGYNLLRVFNIVGFQKLMAAIGAG